MCGVVGIVRRRAPDDAGREADLRLVRRMADTLAHRGPDGDGVLALGSAVLGHRRLAIVDLSANGAQPMRPLPDDPGGAAPEVAITYNGEVYDHAALRAELEALGHRFRSRSDTEVVLQGFRAWGARLPTRLNGMFAFGVYDAATRTLLLARDRYGEKPLFWRPLADGGVAFASEVRALLLLPEQERALDPRAVAKYLAFDAFPADAAAFRGVKKLPAGHTLEWRDGQVAVRRYWERRYWTPGAPRPTPEAAAGELWRLLVTSVERRLMSDVPLGVFLSGGVDSSAILAAMAERVDPARIDAFTIGFDEPSFDESPWARAAAAHVGVRHHVRTLRPGDLVALLPEVLDPLDEPLADASIVPTYALSKLARERVTVALGGDGGDELFAGYDTFLAERLARGYLRLPRLARRGVAALVGALPASPKKTSLQFRASRFVRGLDPDPLARNQRWFGSFLPEEASALVRGGGSADEVYEDLRGLARPAGEQAALELWTGIYLPDDVLTKVDRASMRVSLEVRAPLLDPELASWAHALPYDLKLRGLTRKWVLKRALEGRLPRALLHRTKQGFGPPFGEWLRGPLRGEVLDLLAPARVARAGLLDPTLVDAVVRGHLGGRRDHRKQVWALYVLARVAARHGLW